MKRKLLFAAALVASALGFNANAQAPENGTYYLYNEEAGLFLGRGAAYGTEAVPDKYGVPLKLTTTDGVSALEYVDWANGFLFVPKDNSQNFTTGVYTDNASTGWEFINADNDGYYIKQTGRDAYIRYDNGTLGLYINVTATTIDNATVWKVLSIKEHDDIVAAYPTDNINNVIEAASLDTDADGFEELLSTYSAINMTDVIGTAKFNGARGDWTFNQIKEQGGQPKYGANFMELWQATGTVTQTIDADKLPAGIYKLTVDGFDRPAGAATSITFGDAGYSLGSTFVAANNEQAQLKSWYNIHKEALAAGLSEEGNYPNDPAQFWTCATSDKVNTTSEVYVYLDGETDLTIKLQKHSFVGDNWVCFNNFTLTYYTNENATATDEDYKALNDAINAYKLGFQEGEYAPYNNLELAKALVAAKAINQEAENLKKTVDEALNALTEAQKSVKVNTEEVNAVYNGDFALSEPNTVSGKDLDVPGWTCTDEAIRLLIGDPDAYPGLNSIKSGKALFVHGNKITMYGEVEGYTMPLAAHTVYKLAFQHTGWGGDGKGGNNSFAVSILDSKGKGLQITQCGQSTAGPGVENCWNTFTIIFTTEEAGNYVLNMMPNGNSTFTDITLFKADSQELVFGDNMPSYAPGTYPTVKIEREFSADKWATAVYPFAIPATAATVATLTDFDEDGVLNFSTESASVANEPCLIKAESPIVLNNVKVEAKAAKAVESNGITFNGVYSKTELVAGDDDDFINYVLSGNTLYPVGSNAATVNAYRAYFQLADEAEVPEETKSRLIISVDGENGEATGIDAVEIAADKAVGGEIYNLAGQRVAQPTNGIYIVNGKKVLIKK